ncbi:ABC transporter ATP-binding protein/permease [Microvirga roseola]|uniref:ABC transporter ATP-binding protein/permease n=1 Tax=Microvirga roseola TaxID=2883126 RepID=UPI001E5EA410|nr:ABC transporter ATP-binding protein/permease [Microvirga roseola]
MTIQATILRPDAAPRRRSPVRFQRLFGQEARSFSFLSDVWSLARPYWQSDERGYARRMLALLLAIKFTTIWICVQQNHWYASFYAAIESRDVSAFMKQIGLFGLIAGSFIASLVYSHWVAESLKLRWRNWLVRRYTRDWLSNRAYYRLQLHEEPGTNPDQRIVEDLGLFAGQTINLSVGFLDVAVSLIAFTTILWGLSGTVTVAGFSIAGYMVFAIFGYTFLASWFTHLIGNPLAKLHTANQNLESDFRYGLVRLRENAETIAFYRGEEREAGLLDERWTKVVGNFWSIMRRERSIGFFAHTHGQFSIILPFLLSAPRFFTGQITFAQVMQIAAACGAVRACLNFFITSYGQIAQWRATTERLKSFRKRLDEAKADASSPVTAERGGEAFVVRDLELALPSRKTLVTGVNLEVARGEAVLIKGASGTGKSTMLRAVAGIWPYASGRISFAESEVFFVPQKPYLPLGTLRQAAFYPAVPSGDDEEVARVLEAVRLGHLIERLDEVDNWGQLLSGGEQQRLGFARILLAKPQTVFLDEATSALDEDTERYLYELLRKAEWKPTILSIGHRSTLDRFHDGTFELKAAA